jgi:hypothetical protein
MARTAVEAAGRARASRRHPVAVAIPARNEADLIGPCLAALAAAAETAANRVAVVVLVNNSDDATAAVARTCTAPALDLVVVEARLPPALAHAGGARRAALDRAAALLPPDGVLMTTDADSVVDRHWIAANLAEIDAGADAVAGIVAFDDFARAALPTLPGRDLEWRLAGLQAQLASLLDPRPHDPWPNHLWTWGASIALTLSAYTRVGGLPAVPLAEDRALAAALERHDLKLRHSHAAIVYTSARQVGRAPGGFADLLAAYAVDPASTCDAALEPVADLVRRLRRRAWLRGKLPADGFGAAWSVVEATTPELARRRVVPAMLAAEIDLAERVISRLEAGRGGTAAFAPAE